MSVVRGQMSVASRVNNEPGRRRTDHGPRTTDHGPWTMNQGRRTTDCGLTIIEVLVILLILGIVVGALIIFIYQARQRAARMGCANNLRILGQGVYNAQGLNPRQVMEQGVAGPLPAARIAPGYATWAVQLAPYLEPVGAVKEWDLHKSYFEQTDDFRRAASPLFLCPER